jgi:dTMP kinase
MRGRTFSAAYTAIRIGTLLGLGLFPLIAGLLEGRLGGLEDLLSVGSLQIELPGSRVTLMLAGVFAILGGVMSMRAIKERWSGAVPVTEGRGYFVVFEGGEGAGKTTQIEAFVKWLEAQGRGVVATREPGGTEIGTRIRKLLLDPENRAMDERAEALLYAADRAQHVSEVIKPSLDEGKIVVSDRFIDSSLAYQGLARGLGLEEIYRLSEFATCGLLPDIVFYMRVDPEEGMRRVGASRDPDRIEQEGDGFHERVGAAYLEIAERYPRRFIVLDASRAQSEVHADVIKAFEERTAGLLDQMEPWKDLGPPGPVAR